MGQDVSKRIHESVGYVGQQSEDWLKWFMCFIPTYDTIAKNLKWWVWVLGIIIVVLFASSAYIINRFYKYKKEAKNQKWTKIKTGWDFFDIFCFVLILICLVVLVILAISVTGEARKTVAGLAKTRDFGREICKGIPPGVDWEYCDADPCKDVMYEMV